MVKIRRVEGFQTFTRKINCKWRPPLSVGSVISQLLTAPHGGSARTLSFKTCLHMITLYAPRSKQPLVSSHLRDHFGILCLCLDPYKYLYLHLSSHPSLVPVLRHPLSIAQRQSGPDQAYYPWPFHFGPSSQQLARRVVEQDVEHRKARHGGR